MEEWRVLLTGASGGIGRELVRGLCKEGARVLGVGRNLEVLQELKKTFKECFSPIVVDLLSPKALDTIYAEVVRLDGIDVLINNAGYSIVKRLTNHSLKELTDIMTLNAIIPIALVSRLKDLIRKGGFIVNVVTAGIHALLLDMPSYGASKIALHYMAQILRNEVRGKFNVINVYPISVKTEFFRRAGVEVPKNSIEPEAVSEAIINAIKKGFDGDLYIPRYVKLIRYFLGPHLVPYKLRGVRA